MVDTTWTLTIGQIVVEFIGNLYNLKTFLQKNFKTISHDSHFIMCIFLAGFSISFQVKQKMIRQKNNADKKCLFESATLSIALQHLPKRSNNF